jgi:hypothetical protein
MGQYQHLAFGSSDHLGKQIRLSSTAWRYDEGTTVALFERSYRLI